MPLYCIFSNTWAKHLELLSNVQIVMCIFPLAYTTDKI